MLRFREHTFVVVINLEAGSNKKPKRTTYEAFLSTPWGVLDAVYITAIAIETNFNSSVLISENILNRLHRNSSSQGD